LRLPDDASSKRFLGANPLLTAISGYTPYGGCSQSWVQCIPMTSIKLHTTHVRFTASTPKVGNYYG